MRIVLIDSGVDPGHPGVRGRGRFGDGFRIEADGTAIAEAAGQDRLGHGTAVACAILALAPDSEIVPVRVFLGEASCSPTQVIAALAAAARLHAALVNVSLGLTDPLAESGLCQAIAELRASGARVVAPAGLQGRPCLPGSLADVDAVVADANVPRTQPELRQVGDRRYWFASPSPPPGVAGVPAARIFGDSLAVANVTGFLAATGGNR